MDGKETQSSKFFVNYTGLNVRQPHIFLSNDMVFATLILLMLVDLYAAMRFKTNYKTRYMKFLDSLLNLISSRR